jgi:hypothetical protein
MTAIALWIHNTKQSLVQLSNNFLVNGDILSLGKLNVSLCR